MRRKKRSSVDVELYDSDHTYEDLLKLVDDSNKGDVDLDLKLIAEFNRVRMLPLHGLLKVCSLDSFLLITSLIHTFHFA